MDLSGGTEYRGSGRRAGSPLGPLLFIAAAVVLNVALFLIIIAQPASVQRVAANLVISIFNGAKVLLFFAMIYLYLPARTLPFLENETGLDRVFMGLTAMSAAAVVFVHVLALTGLYDPISAWIALVAIYAGFYRLRSKHWRARVEASLASAFGRLLDAVDARRGVIDGMVRPALRVILLELLRLCGRFSRFLRSSDGILAIVAMAYPVYLRFHHAVTKAYYAYGDPYVHLAWMKYMATGQMYQDGIYPHGMHAILSLLEKVCFIDPYWIVRYMGAIVGSLIVLTILLTVYSLTGEMPAAALAAFIYGIEWGLPVAGWRQSTTLPQEAAALFFLPSLLFLRSYLDSGNRRYLLFFLAAYFIALATHPFVAMYSVIATVCVAAAAVVSRRAGVSQLASLAAGGLIATLVGTLPYSVGLALHKKFHSVDWALSTQVLRPSEGVGLTAILSRLGPVEALSLAIATVVALTGLDCLRRASPGRWLNAGIGLSALVFFAAYQAVNLGLPQIIDPSRTQMFFAMLAAVLLGIGASTLMRAIPVPRRGVVALLLIVALGVAVHPQPYAREVIEYSAAAETYLRIERSFPALTWTLVAPVEQYQQVLGRGWHYEIWRFVTEFTSEQVARPDFLFPIPTADIFVLVEKVPLGREGPVSLDMAALALPDAGGKQTDTYYRDPLNRSIIEARAELLCRAYASTHEGVSVYYEDDVIRVYHIKNPIEVMPQ